MEKLTILNELRKASTIIESIDEAVGDELFNNEYGSDNFKHYQRISNDMFRVKQAIFRLNETLNVNTPINVK